MCNWCYFLSENNFFSSGPFQFCNKLWQLIKYKSWIRRWNKTAETPEHKKNTSTDPPVQTDLILLWTAYSQFSKEKSLMNCEISKKEWGRSSDAILTAKPLLISMRGMLKILQDLQTLYPKIDGWSSQRIATFQFKSQSTSGYLCSGS